MYLNKQDIDFIKDNINSDVIKLSLNKKKYSYLNIDFCIRQIAARQKIKDKLPDFYNNFQLIFPNSVSLQQSSSSQTALYKSKLVSYNTSCDLTGGMGIDSIAFAKNAKKHYYIEKDKELCGIFEHNAEVMGLNNIEIINSNSLVVIENLDCDLYYADPARRDNSGKKTFLLSDIIPNPKEIISKISNKNRTIMLKLSPMLDIDYSIRNLEFISEVHSIAIDDELKELLLIIDETNNKVSYSAYHYKKSDESRIVFNTRTHTPSSFSQPFEYIYIPNPALMKLSVFGELCEMYSLKMLAPNSHIFTSNSLVSTFPGKIYQIIAVEKYDKKSIMKHLPDGTANISVRNFPVKAEKIRTELKIKDSDKINILFTTDLKNSKIAIICKKPCNIH